MDQDPSTPQPTDQQPPPQNPQPPLATTSADVPTPSPSFPPPTTTINTSFPNPNPTPAPEPPPTTPQSQPSTTTTTPQTRPPFNTRPWQQQTYSHFTLPSPPLTTSSDSTLSSVSAPPPPRGGMAIGVPAQIPSTPPPPFSSLTPPTYSQQSQIKPPMQGIGMTGPLGSTSSLRPSHQLRPPQSSPRPPQASSISPSPSPQETCLPEYGGSSGSLGLCVMSFQGHGMLRGSSFGTPGSSSSPNSSQSQHQTQPWLSSGTHGKPPLPTPSPRPQSITQSFQQRAHITQTHQYNMPTTSQQQQSIGSSQQPLPQPSASGQKPQDHFSPPFTGSRIQQSITHQQQIARGPGLGSQRSTLGMTQSVGPTKTASADTDEYSNRIVSKRSIQELVNQIDPSEKLDPEVEDILVDIAEDFVESITTFGCSLAKHRKSTTLEAKDILLHLERDWNMTLPGFGGDEIKTYRKPTVSEVHRDRLAAVKKSILVNDMMNKNSAGPSGGTNAKSHPAKGPASNIGAS
ncbi:hypothetical protein CASFOL_027367 [Castilleja foliolosa]|uniref:Transcription initiation factor TFIID subunit 12 domain-containing protein n=1 Tax=Castilleja foliolosa TaxID=1961234 RepID=A0ABD3CG54_9LAMI